MSGTDSDLDFESADEDTEFASKVDTQKPQSSIIKELSEVTPITTEVKQENVTSIADAVAETINPGCELPTSFPAATQEEPEESTENQEKNNQQISEPVQNIVKPTKTKKVVKLAEKICDTSDSKTPEVKPDLGCKESESRHEKQRVVLRLEKKLQQKQISKESSVEKEKFSDSNNPPSIESNPPQSSWGFSSWGSSLLSTAASTVSTFSNQVTQGIGTVLETVESSLGAPSPEELASSLNEKKEKEEEDRSKEKDSEIDSTASMLSDMSSWTKVFENTGSKVLMGGLGTLEMIGKKTMDILTEGDPGMRKKRAMFSDGANLSEILREAKARADEQNQSGDSEDADNIHYSLIFDEKQGLVHLEALEILSQQNLIKLQRLLLRHSKNTEVKKRLEEIRSICENIPSLDDNADYESFEDFEAVFRNHTIELTLPLNVDSIINTQKQIDRTIKKYESICKDSEILPKEIFQSAVYSLAEFTAKCIETFHKVAELILVQPSLDSERCATNLTGLTTVMCIETHNLSSRFHKCLESLSGHLSDEASSNKDITIMATNLYVEAANSNKYIQDAYQMLAPILQVCLLEAVE